MQCLLLLDRIEHHYRGCRCSILPYFIFSEFLLTLQLFMKTCLSCNNMSVRGYMGMRDYDSVGDYVSVGDYLCVCEYQWCVTANECQ